MLMSCKSPDTLSELVSRCEFIEFLRPIFKVATDETAKTKITNTLGREKENK